MVTKVWDYMNKNHMTAPGDVVIVGVSGGADSLCLLLVLLQIAKEADISLEVVHVNHGIRKEASQDEEFVRVLCEQKKLPFHAVHADVEAFAKKEQLSTEEAGRLIRYEAFEKALNGRKGKIAVAHHANDRAETMLFHLFRGTGLRGACGIRPVQGSVIRPLLCIRREEIEQWLKEQHLTFCVDATNEEDLYTRNRIRHHILSYAENEIVHGAVANMNRAAQQLEEAEDYLEKLTEEAFKRCCAVNGVEAKEITFALEKLCGEDEYLQKRVILQGICMAAGERKDLTQEHVLSVLSLFHAQGNGELHLPYGLCVYKRYGKGMIQKNASLAKASPIPLPEIKVTVPSQYELPSVGCVEFQVFPYVKSACIPQKRYTKWFDYDKITTSLVLRTRKTGDYLTINRQMGQKSLQDYFVDEKLPREKRDQQYVLAAEHHILWVLGFRISEYFKVGEATRTVLQVKVITKDEV